MAGYAKLWSGITESSLWGGSKEARLLFVTLLAKADSTGFVEAAPSGLARLANLTRQEIDSALQELTSPDPESKSKIADGKRVAIVPRGVCVVNYEDYRKRRDDEERREYMRDYMRQYRASHETNVNSGKQGKPPLAQAEAEAEAEGKAEEQERPPSAPSVPLLKVKKEKPPKKIKTTALNPESVRAFEVAWNKPPKTFNTWSKETKSFEDIHVVKGSRMQAERNFQAIVDAGVATPADLCYAFQSYILEGEGPKKGFFQHVSTFFGPEKATYLEWLERGRELSREGA